MKQCPVCKTTYTDSTLRYCLADGNPLADLAGEQETAVIQGGAFHDAATIAIGAEPARTEIPRETVQIPAPAFQTAEPVRLKSSGTLFKVVMVLIGLGILAVLAIAAGTFIYFNMSGSEKAANVNSGKDVKIAASPTPTATPDEDAELRETIANLEKLLTDQSKSDQPANIPHVLPDQSTMTKTARVNSPSDGFLALRALPSSEVGERIAKIPHGATISIGACGPVIKPVNRKGRWCQASYGGYSGWIFDAYVIY